MPMVVGAQDTGLVTCVGPDCNWCSLMSLVNNVVEWLIIFLSVIAVIVLVIAGFKLVTSAGNTEAWSSAKSMFTNVILGIIIVLAAWLAIDTTLVMLTGGGINYWLPDDCGGANAMTSSGAGAAAGSRAVTGSLVSYEGHQFDSGVVENMRYISENYDLRVSGGYRTEERNAEVNGAANSHHLSGRAGDFVGSQSSMQAARAWALQNGAREALIHNAGSGTHLHVAF